jgi:long-chain fatty acid transport protein
MVLGLTPSLGAAANGLNLIGYGAESTLMGGASIPVARDTSALNTNPAGLAQIQGQRFDGYGTLAHAQDVAHRDAFGNDKNVSNPFVALGGLGYALRQDRSRFAFGIGLFAQGGAGSVYKDLNTAFGTQDELWSLFRIVKLTSGVSYSVTDALSIGASLGLIYADVSQNVFPNTSFVSPSNPSQSFFGYTLRGVYSTNLGIKLGTRYQATESLTFGAAYTHKTPLTLNSGHLTANLSAAGLGRVTYGQASIGGLALPCEIGFGLAWKPAASLLLALELNWLNWADSLKTSTLRATAPNIPAAPPVLQNTASLNWRNQTVVALGLAYSLNDDTTLLAGYNYGRNPIPSQTTTPLLAAITSNHLTFGVERRVSREWTAVVGVEYDLPTQVTYTNPEQPFGTGVQERNEVIALHFMMSRRW